MEEQFPVEGVPSAYASDDFARVVADEPYPLFEDNSLMVENLIRQGLLLNMPVQPLCEHGWDEPCPHEQKLEAELNVAKSALGKLATLKQTEGDSAV